jgi:tetratricopeptide (TPR) repeat protein
MHCPAVIALCALVFSGACTAADKSVISGVVRDAGGTALEGVRVTITATASGGITASSTTDRDGAYRFESLSPIAYTVTAERAGFVRIERADVHPSPSGTVVDFTLSLARPGPKLEAVGIRGLIDPGGYSAPANSAAGTALMERMADLKRTGNSSAAAAQPCSAAALIAAHQFEDARRVLIEGKGAAAHQMLAEAEEGLGRFTEAAHEYAIAGEEQPTEENLFGAGYELVLAGTVDAAETAFRAGLGRQPGSALLLIGLGTAQFLSGRGANAVRTFLEAAAVAPAAPRPYAFLARAFEASGAEPDHVVSTMRRFSEAAPDSGEAQSEYAAVLLRQRTGNSGAEDLREIQQLLERAVTLDPASAQAHRQLAGVYFDEENYSGAIREYEEAIRLAPGRCDLHYRLSAAYRVAKREEKTDSEIKLFQACRSREKQTAVDTGITVEQFISVMRSPLPAAAADPGCAAVPDH